MFNKTSYTKPRKFVLWKKKRMSAAGKEQVVREKPQRVVFITLICSMKEPVGQLNNYSIFKR